MDVQLVGKTVAVVARIPIDAVDWADRDARGVHAVPAQAGNDVRHRSSFNAT
jgi:predicted RecA/RadA family phage recombinase